MTQYPDPIRWLAKYIDGDQMSRYDMDSVWLPENQAHSWHEIDLSKLAEVFIQTKKAEEVCRLNVQHRQIIIVDRVFSLEIKANGNRLKNGKMIPNYFHHSHKWIGEESVLKSYNLAFFADHCNQVGNKFASSKLVACIPVEDGKLLGNVMMMLDVRSFQRAEYEITISVDSVHSDESEKVTLYEGNLDVDQLIEFGFVQLKL